MRPNQAGLGLAQIRPAEDGAAAQADLGRWLTLTELAAETGRRLEGVRSWAKRGARAGRIRTRKTNRGEVQVWATAELLAELEPGAAQADRSADLGRDEAEPRLQARVEELLERATRAEAEAAELWDEAGRWRGKAEEAGQRAARAEGELAAELRRSADLAATVTELRAALAEARRPWLAKVLEGLRRKGT